MTIFKKSPADEIKDGKNPLLAAFHHELKDIYWAEKIGQKSSKWLKRQALLN